MRPALSAVLAVLLVGLLGRSARAADPITPASCVAANEEAGPLRRSGRLREARGKLRLCSAQVCPAAVRKDCVAGAAQTDTDVPTVGFSVQDPSGNDLSAVRVSLDGQVLADSLDGKALDVDPGEHVFRFEASGQPPVEKRLVIVEGEKNRRERVVMGEPKVAPAVVAVVPPPPAVTPPRAPNGRRTAGLAIGGAGLALLAGGGAAGLVAVLEWNAAKNACGSTFPVACADRTTAASDRSATLAASTVADLALGLGAAALVTGGALVLTSPGSSAPLPSAHLTLVPWIGPASNGLVLGGAF